MNEQQLVEKYVNEAEIIFEREWPQLQRVIHMLGVGGDLFLFSSQELHEAFKTCWGGGAAAVLEIMATKIRTGEK